MDGSEAETRIMVESGQNQEGQEGGRALTQRADCGVMAPSQEQPKSESW